MSSDKLLRLAGLAALSAGAFSGIGDAMSLVVDLEAADAASDASQGIVFGFYLLGTVLLLLGLVGLYASQSRAMGMLGFAGFLLAFVGTALTAGAIWFELFVAPELAARAPDLATAELGFTGFVLSFLLAAFGWLLFAIATLRAGVYPRPAAVLLVAGALVSFVPLFVEVPATGLLLSVAVAWLGFVLWRQGSQPRLGCKQVARLPMRRSGR